MSDNAKTGPMTPRMLNLSREVKMLAVTNNIPIVSITAVTDEDGDKRDGPPVLSQVAWSKGIEYDANLVIAIHRHDDTNIVEVVCRKSRHGDPFDFGFEVDFDRGIWIERHDAF
jgi:replicative DNA helicase